MKRLLSPIFSLAGTLFLCTHLGFAAQPQQQDSEIRPRTVSTQTAALHDLIEHAHDGHYQQVVDALPRNCKPQIVQSIFAEFIKNHVAIKNCMEIFTRYKEKLIKSHWLFGKKLVDNFSSQIFNAMVLQAAINGKIIHLRHLLTSNEGKTYVSLKNLSDIYNKLPKHEIAYETHECKKLIDQQYAERLAQAKLEAGIISYVNCPCLFFYDFIFNQ